MVRSTPKPETQSDSIELNIVVILVSPTRNRNVHNEADNEIAIEMQTGVT